MTRIALCLSLLLSACAATSDFAPDSPAAPASTSEDTEPVGGYLASDRATEHELFALLSAHGIHAEAYGSLGYTVAVPVSRAEEARALLADAIAHDGLLATVYTAEQLRALASASP